MNQSANYVKYTKKSKLKSLRKEGRQARR